MFHNVIYTFTLFSFSLERPHAYTILSAESVTWCSTKKLTKEREVFLSLSLAELAALVQLKRIDLYKLLPDNRSMPNRWLKAD